ncbi:MAG TPA: LysR family transcriptional regulator [Xanthobacteraceae bacterium]|jgi:DNA-binding transcriptional LysR family regulator
MKKPISKAFDWDERIGRRVRLRDLHILLSVVQHESMAKAARMLGVSQPAVSEAIAGLEHALDVRLLERSRRGVEPTVYGRALLQSGKAAFNDLRQGIEQIEQLRDPAAGSLRIACPESIAAGILGPIIGMMMERFPRVRLFVEPFLIGSRPLFPQLDNGEADIVFTRPTVPLQPRNAFSVETLFNDRIRLAANKHSQWARRRKIDLADLVCEPWITVPDYDVGGSVISALFHSRGLEAPAISVTTFSIHLRYSLAGNARFIAAMPDSVLRFNAGNLQELPIDLPEPPWPVVMVTPKKHAANPVLERFMEIVRKVAKSL